MDSAETLVVRVTCQSTRAPAQHACFDLLQRKLEGLAFVPQTAGVVLPLALLLLFDKL